MKRRWTAAALARAAAQPATVTARTCDCGAERIAVVTEVLHLGEVRAYQGERLAAPPLVRVARPNPIS